LLHAGKVMDAIQIMKLCYSARALTIFLNPFAVTSGNAPPVLPSWRGSHFVDYLPTW
jgi:hypothetical protein